MVPGCPDPPGSKTSAGAGRRPEGRLGLHPGFIIALPGVRRVLPNRETDPDFARALEEAERAGVEILHLPCAVGPDSLEILD